MYRSGILDMTQFIFSQLSKLERFQNFFTELCLRNEKRKHANYLDEKSLKFDE